MENSDIKNFAQENVVEKITQEVGTLRMQRRFTIITQITSVASFFCGLGVASLLGEIITNQTFHDHYGKISSLISIVLFGIAVTFIRQNRSKQK